jgi:transposase
VDINFLPDDPAVLKSVIADRQAQIAQLEQRLRLLNLIIDGPKSEKKAPHRSRAAAFPVR